MKMKFSYDKLLFGLSGLVLLASIIFCVINFNSSAGDFSIAGQLGSNRYEPIPVPTFDGSTAVWPNAEEQAPGELYDVFTPPAIWIDKDGTFIFKSPIEDRPQVPFDIYLVALEKEPYRIQLEGYIEEDFNDSQKSILLLFDEEKRERIRARVGQSIRKHEISVYNFTIDRIQDADGFTKLAVATILDFRDGRRIFLTHGKRKYKDNVTVFLRSKKDPEFEIKITQKPPYEFKTESAKYILEKISLEESSVTIKRLEDSKQEQEPETKQLFLRPNQTSNKSLESEANTSNQVFDFDF